MANSKYSQKWHSTLPEKEIVEMSLVGPDGVMVTKVCKTAWQVYIFNRDMPFKFGFALSNQNNFGKPYYIKSLYINNI